MQFCVLGSGSKGNATYVSANGTAFLIDSGFSGVEIERRLASIGAHGPSLNAILVTHAHSDHVKGVAVLARKYNLPVYANKGTIDAAGKMFKRVSRICEFQTGSSFSLQHFRIHPFSISHDCMDPVGFVIESGPVSLGYCTDTGKVSNLIRHRLACCNALILECNHDLELLKSGPYPLHLQQRVRSNQGHLANDDTARFVADLLHVELQHIVLAHISEVNNSPELAYNSVAAILQRNKGQQTSLSLAWQDKAGKLITLGK